MPKPISNEFKEQLKMNDSKFIGVELAKVCVEYNFQIIDLAKAFGVSRMTIHNWFRGAYVRRLNFIKISEFLDFINNCPSYIREEFLISAKKRNLFLKEFFYKIKNDKVIKPLIGDDHGYI